MSKENRLTIRFIDGTSQWWFYKNYQETSLIAPWVDFYKWFFCRENSNFHRIKVTDAEHVIQRKNIFSFKVEIINDDT